VRRTQARPARSSDVRTSVSPSARNASTIPGRSSINNNRVILPQARSGRSYRESQIVRYRSYQLRNSRGIMQSRSAARRCVAARRSTGRFSSGGRTATTPPRPPRLELVRWEEILVRQRRSAARRCVAALRSTGRFASGGQTATTPPRPPNNPSDPEVVTRGKKSSFVSYSVFPRRPRG